MSQNQIPLPQIDDRNRPFFAGAQEHRLLIQRCTRCDTLQSPGRFACTECGSDALEWVESTGRGTVFTYVIMHQKYHPAFENDIPYNVAVIELEEGPRLVSNVVDVEPEEIEVGMDVDVMFEPITDEVTLPRFRRNS